MGAQRTASVRRLAEQRKARARVPLLALIALICTPLAGIRSVSIWICYVVFVLIYSVWSLRFTSQFSHDRRAGYLLCLTDVAILLPLLVWSDNTALRVLLVLLCMGGLVATVLSGKSERRVERNGFGRLAGADPFGVEGPDAATGTSLERAVRVRLAVLRATGSRFALVMLRVVRFEETASYYGEETSRRIVLAISRRGLRILGADAQHFVLPGGRVAFLFEIDSACAFEPSAIQAAHGLDPTDIESLAMAVGRKSCERLVDGQRIECVVGWATAPSDGLSADDLMYVAEAGAQSTAAFRRAAEQVSVPTGARVVAG